MALKKCVLTLTFTFTDNHVAKLLLVSRIVYFPPGLRLPFQPQSKALSTLATSRRIRQLSPKTATVAWSPNSGDYSRPCGQGITE